MRESFYSATSADGFRLRHKGHDAQALPLAKGRPETASPESAQPTPLEPRTTVASEKPARPPPRQESPTPRPPLDFKQRSPAERVAPRQEAPPVSASLYARGGEATRREAARLSTLLTTFGWRVEPAYTIGAIVDDVLGIETAGNQISRTFISKVEEEGFLLVAVTIQDAKLVAWFKRAVLAGPPSTPGT